jgi:hypothetical protein
MRHTQVGMRRATAAKLAAVVTNWRRPATAALVTLLLVPTACSSDDAALERSPAADPTTTTAPTTTAAPTTTTVPPEAVLAPIPGCPPPPPIARPDPDRPVYTADVDVQPAASLVTGEVSIRFTPDLPTDVVVLRLWPNAPTPAAAGARMTAGPAVRLPGRRALATTQPDATLVEVALGEQVAAGDTIEIAVPFSLSVPGSVSDRISQTGDTLRLGSFMPLLAWEPGVGWAREPATSLFAEAVTSPAADYDVLMNVPDGYDVLASGVRGPDGRWRITGARDFAASVGHFTVASATENLPYPVAVTVGVDAGVGDDPNVYLERVRAALRDFAARYGFYPWPAYNLAITPGLNGGIEFPGLVQQGPGTDGRTTPHEVGHMWFYGLVGNNQARDPWLDEGLASYAEFRHEGTLAQSQRVDIPSDAEGRADEPMTYWEGHRRSYYRGVYVQGAVAVASLGSVDQVDCALRHYVAANAFGLATTDDLYAALGLLFPDARARLAPFVDA